MPDNVPQYSIIIPVYNTADYIEACIRSVLDQSFRSLEIIAVDDGSTDASRQILDSLARQDSRLRIFSKENGGQGAARNYGLGKARGPYVAFVDSDDTISSDLLQIVSEIVSNDGIDVVSFGIDFVDRDGRSVARRIPNAEAPSTGRQVFLDAMLDKNFYSVVWNKVYKRSLLVNHEIYFPEIRAYEDSIFSREVALYANEVIYLNQPLYHALTRSGSTSRGMNKASFTRAADMLALERSVFRDQFADPLFQVVYRAHVAHFLAYLSVLAAFRIDDPVERAACRLIADNAGFRDAADDRGALALLSTRARAQTFLARHPALLRATALVARRLGRVPY